MSMLNFCVTEPKPPVLVIDEATLKTAYDAGPACECRERYLAVKNLKPFLPGGTLKYKKAAIQDEDCLEVFWVPTRIEPRSGHFVKAVAIHRKDLPMKYMSENQNQDDFMFIKPTR